MIKDVTDLDVYNQSLVGVRDLYVLMHKVPRSESDLILQIKRASKSIPANIAEGFGKRYFEKEFKRYLKIAIGSSDEVITHLRVLAVVCPVVENDAIVMIERYKVISKRINTLCSRWQSGGSF